MKFLGTIAVVCMLLLGTPLLIHPATIQVIAPSKLVKVAVLYPVTATAYNPGDPNQCFGRQPKDWITGAWGETIYSGDISVSRDLLKHPDIKNGTFICLYYVTEQQIHCGSVKDTMNARFKRRVDVAIRQSNLTKAKKAAKDFGKRKAILYVFKEEKYDL